MKRTFLILLLTFIIPSEGWAERSAALPAKFSLPGLKGGKISRKNLQGKVVVMQFWASWCVGCKSVMHELLQREAKEKNFLWLPVSVDESMAEARSYFKAVPASVKPAEKRSYLDADGKLAEQFGITSLPAVVVLSPDGEVLQRINGHPGARDWQQFQKTVQAVAH